MSRFDKYLEAVSGPRLSREIDYVLNRVGVSFVRKPATLKEIKDNNKLNIDDLDAFSEDGSPTLQDTFVYMIKDLKVYDSKDLWDSNEPKLLNNFVRPIEQFFILSANDSYYLVNTEGYNYCRYMLEIPDYSTFL